MTETAWIHASSPPRFYPNAVILDARPDKSLPQIERLLASRAPSAWSGKDSFAALDLTPLGGRVLFTAEWRWRDPSPHAHSELAATRVRDEATLARWEQAWRQASGEPDTSSPIFLPALLADENVAIIALSGAHVPIHSGVIAYRAAGVVGVSNLFGPTASSEQERTGQLLDGIRAARHLFSELPVVSYGTSSNTASAAQAGFTSLGSLRVWVNSSR